MRNEKGIIFLLTALFVSTISYGKNIHLTLPEAIEKAYIHDYTLRNSHIDVESSALKVKEAHKQFLPTVDYSGKYTEYQHEKVLTSGKTKDYFDHSIALSQPLFQGGSLTSQLSTAKHDLEKKKIQYQDSKNDTMLSAINRYIAVLLKEREVEVYKLALKNMQEQHLKANKKFELDMIAKSEVLPFNTRMLNLKTKLIESENGLEMAKANLKNYLGMDSKDELALDDIDASRYLLEDINLEEDIKHARENNRSVKIAGIDRKIKENDKVAARSDFMPKVSATVTYKSGDNDLRGSADNFNWEAGVNVRMNVFSFGQSADKYQRVKHEEVKAENLESKMKDSVELNLRTNYINLLKYKGIVEEQKSAAEFARENFNLEARRYEMELTDAISLVEIEKNLIETELSLAAARYNYFMAYEQYKGLLN